MSKDETKGTADRDSKDEDDEDEDETEEGGSDEQDEEEEGASDEQDDDAEDEDEDGEDEDEEEASADAAGSDDSDDSDEDSDEDDSDDEDEDETDEDETDEDETDEDETDEDETDEAPAASARPAHDDGRAERARRRRELEHGALPVAGAAGDDEDPTWWAPHAVLGVLVLVGVLGFFGAFNKALGFLAAPRPAGAETATPAAATAAPTTRPASVPMPQNSAAQQPREMFGAKHVLVMYKGGRRAPANIERSKEDAKKRADEVLKKAKSGTKFEDLVKEYSDEPNAAQRGGDLGQFPKGAMVPEFQAGLEKTKVNEISDVVESPFGYHIILRTK